METSWFMRSTTSTGTAWYHGTLKPEDRFLWKCERRNMNWTMIGELAGALWTIVKIVGPWAVPFVSSLSA